MKEKYDEQILEGDSREYMEDVISTYGGISDCNINKCKSCDLLQVEECYGIAQNNCNHEFAESIDYGGYDSEDEFWDNL